MALLRDMPLTVIALEERQLITCSTGSQSVVGSTANSIASCNSDPASTSAVGVSGRIIDRRGIPAGTAGLTARYQVAIPQAFIWSTRGSTEANRYLALGIKLQHGDSSGGGDMADYSTGSQPATRVFFTTARTTDMSNWDAALSTGQLFAETLPAYYDLRGAKRYIQAVVYAAKNRVTTESSGDEGARISAVLTFAAGDEAPQIRDTTGPLSTSTST